MCKVIRSKIVFATCMPFWQRLKDLQVIFIFSSTAMWNIHFFAHKLSPWITFCIYTEFSWYNYTFTGTCHNRLDFLRWNATFQRTTWILWHNPTPLKKISHGTKCYFSQFFTLRNFLPIKFAFVYLGLHPFECQFSCKKNLHFITYSACTQ